MQAPRIVLLAFQNTGRADITEGMFHDGDPVVIDLGADAIAILDVEVTGPSGGSPSLDVDGRTVLVRPGLLKRGQKVRVWVLADGREGSITCRSLPLVDCQLSGIPDARARPSVRGLAIATGTAITAVGAVVGVASGSRAGSP